MRYAVFLRGVNVGGHGKLPMKPFCAALTQAGFQDVSSYIQSGNILLHSDQSAQQVETQIGTVMANHFDLTRPVLALTADQVQAIVDQAPETPSPKALMIYLHRACANLDAFAPYLSDTEHVTPGPGCTYLLAPNGIGRSKAAAKADTLLPNPVTARNLNTLLAVAHRL